MKPRIIFFGTADFSVPTLEALLANGYDVVATVTKPDTAAGRGRATSEPAVKRIARRHHIPVLQPAKLDNDFVAELKKLDPTAGVLVAYGNIVPQAVIDVFPAGIINIHASLLPRYRGPSPIEAAILSDDRATGISIMRIDAGMDTGPVYITESIPLTGDETRLELYHRLSQLGAQTLVLYLNGIIKEDYLPKPQPTDGVSVVPMIRKSDGMLDPRKPAIELEREVRAYSGWPGSRTTLAGRDVTVTASHVLVGALPTDETPSVGDVITHPSVGLGIQTSEGILVIERLKPAGKPEMAAADFVRGLGNNKQDLA